ncbi:MAG: ribosomal protein L7/L12, partial [Bacteroidales bacterium]|nr:ribosomal protein L7/L12 [Bacteroidales bacterium]
MNTSFKKFIVTLGIVCLGFVQSFAINQIDGDWADYGLTSAYDGYYVIATAQDLRDFRDLSNRTSGDITINGVLTANIKVNQSVLDANGELRSDYETAVTDKWTSPISAFSRKYAGTFDGRNYTISGLYITGTYYIGLFGYEGNGTVKNLNITDSYFKADAEVGGICGSVASSSNTFTILNCSVNAYVTANGEGAGGIIGGYASSSSVIDNCVNKGKVVGSGEYVGGICARWSGTLTNCSNTGIVKGSSIYVGGIAGICNAISLCYNTGTVSGAQYVGGIVGNGGPIQKCCNLGDVTGVTYVGGIVGSTSSAMSDVFNVGAVSGDNGYVGGLAGSAGNISYAYNAGLVSNNSYLTNVGGLCGKCSGTMTSCYYDSNVCPFKAVNNATYSGATAKTTTQMCSTTLLTGFSSSIWTAGSTSVSGSLTKIDDEFATKINGRYPRLTAITKYPYAKIRYYNTGTASSPTWVQYTPIYSTVDFASMNNSSDVFVLMNDIVEASNMSDGNLLETPAVTWTPITLFEGKLYGRGKTISGLCMTSGTNGGLFTTINNATITDVNIARCSFKGTSSVGSIAAIATGECTITNCNNYCDFNVSASWLGGICGSASSGALTIKNSNNYGKIIGTGNCGGIVGNSENTLNIMECINYGEIEGDITGGILGRGYGMGVSKGVIQQCINYGTIISTTGNGGVGGISGKHVAFSALNYCLNNGNILNTSTGATGGILGSESSGDAIRQCLNLSAISCISSVGAIVGTTGACSTIYNYYNSDSCSYQAVNNGDIASGGMGKTTTELIVSTLPLGFSSDYWAIRPAEIRNMKKYYYFPYLKCFGEESAILAQVKDCHTVSINLNGGTTTDNIITFYVETEQALLPTNVQKDGCTFDGWYDNSNYTSNPFTEVPLTETQPKSFYAKWLANNYTITYSLDGGTINNGNVQLYTYGYGTMLPTDVTKTGYTFGGWYTNSSFTTQVTSVSSTEYGNKTFYARWDAIPYTITYNANEGTISSTPQTTYYYGSVVNLPTPTRQGYSFNGWYNNSNLTGNEVTAITSTDFGDKAFYAKWTANEYTVSLNPDGGKINVGDVTNYTYGTYTMLPNNVTRTGYTFQGWFTIQSCDAVLVSCQKTIPFIKAVQSVFGYSLIQARDSVYSWYDNLPVHLSMTVTKALEFQKQAETCDAIVSLENMVLSGGNTVCDLILESYGSSKLSVIKIVKNYTGLGLTQAKTLVESAPVAVLTQVPEETALAMKGELDAISGVVTSFANNAGGTATTAIYPTDLGDKYLGAKWEANTYSVNLQVNGGTNTNNVSEYTYGVGATLPDSSEISRTGYTFVGWYMNSNYDGVAIEEIATTDFGDKTFYAKWNVNSYDVTLNANGGTINSGNIASYTYGVGATLPTDITKTGYTFGGWYDNSSCSGSSVLSIASNATDDKEFWAKWDTINYTITYNANEGEFAVTPVSNYKYGDEIVLATPTREGYDFGGWYNNSNLVGTEFTKVEATETGNKEFWAKWDVQSYDVTLNVNEGTINSGNLTIYTYGTLAILPQDVTKVGHKFDGWFDNEGLSGTAVTQISKGSAGDKTFYAGWTPRTYTVTLQTNNGTINNGTISSYTYGKGATLPTDITKTGYEFQGWYDNSSYDGGKVTAIASNEVGDRNFWAKWTANTYTVNFETNDGTINSGNINGYTYGVTAILPTDVTKDGYTFTGWYSDEECKGDVVSIISSTETGNKTFYAGWSKSAYSVTLHTNDGIISSGNVTAYTFGSEIKLPTEEQIGKTGYTFGGWYDNASCIGSSITSIPSTEIGNKQFWAKWSVNTYNITFVMNEGTINSGNVKNYVYGTTVVLPSDVVKTGYMFDGWYIDEDCSGESVLSILST